MKLSSFLVTFLIIGSGFFAWRSFEPHTNSDIAAGKIELSNKLIHSASWSLLYSTILTIIVAGAKSASESSSSSSSGYSPRSISSNDDDSIGFDITDLISSFNFNNDDSGPNND